MAKVSLSEIGTNNRQGNQQRVNFFSLQNDGDEAIVRIMHDSVDSFDILSTHQIKVNDRFRRINCLRSGKEPVENCPFCAGNIQLQTKIYIHLVQYYWDESGNVIAEPKVWERSSNWAQTLKSYIDNYGPLSDIVCKIIRHGAKGDLRTSYEIIPNLNPKQYSPDVIVKHPEFFDGYDALGTVVLDKPFQDCVEYLNTGNFPMPKSDNASERTVATNTSSVPADSPAQYTRRTSSPAPWETTSSSGFKPERRSY